VRYRGADTLEMDSYVSADGVLMVTHDMRPSGTSNAPNSSDFEIRDLTVEQLKAYDFAWKFTPGKGHYSFSESDPHPYRGIATGDRPAPTGYSANDFTIATFEEVLDAFPDTPLNVDMKSYGADPGVSLAAAEALAGIMNRHPERSKDVIVASFDQAAIERFHELAPNHLALSGSLDASVPYAFGQSIRPTPVAIQPPDLFDFSGSLVRTVPLLKPFTDYDGYALHVWGSDIDPDQETDAFYARLIEEGADGFFTQQPGRLHQYLCEAGIRRPDGARRCRAQPPTLVSWVRQHRFAGPRKVRAGQRARFEILLAAAGNTGLRGLKVCLKVRGRSARFIRVPRCARSEPLGIGKLFERALVLRTGRRARGLVTVSLEVTADGGIDRTTNRILRIRPRR
jgi:glycerophosphoryl diester phosphodiesterase